MEICAGGAFTGFDFSQVMTCFAHHGEQIIEFRKRGFYVIG